MKKGKPGAAQIARIVKGVLSTRPEEIDCDECLEQLDYFAELTLEDKAPAEAIPLVQDHLNRCVDCRAEFEALLTALRVETDSDSEDRGPVTRS